MDLPARPERDTTLNHRTVYPHLSAYGQRVSRSKSRTRLSRHPGAVGAPGRNLKEGVGCSTMSGTVVVGKE
jgi:hypothetical protein